jgi:SHS2 domain-containing protein
VTSKNYRVFSHTADVGLVVHGTTLSKLFENASRGMLELLTNPKLYLPKITVEFQLKAPDLESLLADWLHEILYYFTVRHIAFKRIRVKIKKDGTLYADGIGEKLDPARHPVYREIKAVTHHDLKIKRSEKNWSTRIIFDI